MPFNAADTRHLRTAKAAAKATAEAEARVIFRIMSDHESRRWMHDLLASCHCFATTFTGEALSGAFGEGERSVGLRLLAAVVSTAPDQYIQMMRESADKEQADGRRYDSPRPNDDGHVGDSANGGRDDSAGSVASDYNPSPDDAG